MAGVAFLPAMNGEKALHPFFTKPSSNHEADGSMSSDDAKVTSDLDQLDGAQDKASKVQKNLHARKPRSSIPTIGKTQKTLQEIVNPRANDSGERNDERKLEIPDSCSSDPTFSSPRRKRRRTSQTEYIEIEDHAEPQGDDAAEPQANGTKQRQSSPQVVVPASSPLPIQVPEMTAPASKTPPKKMLRLNASGKFSSPISKASRDEEQPIQAPKKRGRPRKSKEPEPDKHLIVKMKYNNDGVLGPRVDRILSGEERFVKEVKISTPKKQNKSGKQQSSKATHPFFLGKPNDPPPQPKHESPRKASAVTPGKLRRQTMSERSPDKKSMRAAQDYVVGSGLLKDRLILKHPGAKEPAWPNKEQAHVRGLDESEATHLARIAIPDILYSRRKGKAAKVPFPNEESLLEKFSARLEPEQDGDLRPDGFRQPHPSLTLPEKLLITGEEIRLRVGRKLSAQIANADDGDDELIRSLPAQSVLHPVIRRLYDRIPNSMSSFDEGRGEAMSWTQKYEPSNAADVLQPSREVTVLKEWLTALTVTSVGSTSKSEAKLHPKLEPKPKGRRRRKHDEMDDFLVDDDEDLLDMDELSDPDGTSPPSFNGRKTVKSVVQAPGDGVKLSNAILLSGPHGCGKTAAAHAVAKELGFKVFEISPCERRSGKDVIDKVGDMTENHLVKHHGTDTAEASAAEEPNRIDEAFQRDLASGRQGKMNAFFKPKLKAKDKSPKKKAPQKKGIVEAVQRAIKKPAKEQQQSLILLEEVDVLFKEDKDFWNTVFKLIVSSKRPFIMTCNDEDLVPVQAMSLHAILRFSPPPLELATDYLLLMAAAEGHLLKRDPVVSLYKSKGYDLRASIADLDFWCQMGVGDPRGGLSWIFQRFPPGSDLDSQGRRLRVVSEGTYSAGQALLPNRSLDHETQLLWAQHEFGIDPAELLSCNDLSPNFTHSLKDFDRMADSFSAADVYDGKRDRNLLDTTQQPMPDKARSQYIEGMVLLQTDECRDYSDVILQLRITTILAARRATSGFGHKDVTTELTRAITSNSPDTSKAAALTRGDFACFDAVSVASENVLFATPGLSQSVFDGPLEPIATDIAPYVRSIVHFDLALAEQRERLSSLTSHGRLAKRARTTRAARSALEGGQRASTRRERWFTKDLDVEAVLATAGNDWPKPGLEVGDMSSRDGTETPASSAEMTGQS